MITPLNPESSPIVADNTTQPPPDLARAEQRLALALWREDQHQPVAARLLFEEALQLNPANIAFRMAYIAFLLRQAEWPVAKEALTQAIETDSTAATAWLNDKLQHQPDELALLYLQALLLIQLGRQNEALVTFGRLLQIAPNYGQAWVDQATVLEGVDQPERAERSYRTALEIDPNNVSWRMAYSTFLEKGERYEEALRILEYALALAPGDVDLQMWVEELKRYANREVEARKRAALAELKLKKDDVAEAAALIAEALQMAPTYALAHRVQADVFRRQGLLARAEAHLFRAIELEPDNPEHQIAQQAFQAQVEPQRERVRQLVAQARAAADRKAASLCLDEALKLIADDVDVHVVYAEWLAPDSPDEAEQHLKTALAVVPRHLEATKRYVMFLCQQGRWPEAEPYFRGLVGILPQDEELTDAYAGWLMGQGRYQEVLNLLASQPVSARLQGKLAVALAYDGQLTEAQKKFETALEIEPQNATLHGEYAGVLRQVGRWTEADNHFRKALELEPGYVAARCEYADLLLTRQHYHEARQHIQLAQTLRPGDMQIEAKVRLIEERLRQFEAVEAELAYAVWLGNEDRVAEASDAFDQALTSAPDSVIVLRKYALFLEDQGKLDQAKILLEKVQQLMPGDQEIEVHYTSILNKIADCKVASLSSPDVDTPGLTVPPIPESPPLPPEPPVEPPPPPSSALGFIKDLLRRLTGGAK